MLRILHVEDDRAKVQNLRDSLEDFEVEVDVDHVWGVDDGLEKLASSEHGYVFVVTDWWLQDGYGDVVVRRCKELGLAVCVYSGAERQMRDVDWTMDSNRAVTLLRRSLARSDFKP